MKGRVFVGGLHHESDTFNPIITRREDIWVIRGEELFEKKQSSSSGICNTLVAAGYEVIPSLIARAVPNGVWEHDYYQELKAELLQDLKNAGDLDAICLSLHGSMRVDCIGEAEGDLLDAIREIHPKTLMITSLDMHATLTKRMRKAADGFVGYKCAPHTDTYETGIHAALMVQRSLESGIMPTMSVVRIPMLIAGEQSETSVEPMKSLISGLRKKEREKGVLACTYLLGFPWADEKENAVHALVVTQNNQKRADELSSELAETFWSRRKEFCFYTETRMPDDSLDATNNALSEGSIPVVISDSGDNPTAGGSGDVTNFLQLIMKDKELSSLTPPLIYQGFYDPQVVEQALKLKVGDTFLCSLGAKFDTVKSQPIKAEAKLLALKEGWDAVLNVDLVLIHIGGIDVVLVNKHVGCYDPEMMRVLSVEPTLRKVIVVKLGYLEPEIRAISKRSIMALTTGSTDELFERLPYKNISRPTYPLDGDFDAELEFLF